MIGLAAAGPAALPLAGTAGAAGAAGAAAFPWAAGAQFLSGLAGMGQAAPGGPAISGGAPVTVQVGGVNSPPWPFAGGAVPGTPGGALGASVSLGDNLTTQIFAGVAAAVLAALVLRWVRR